jgi:2-iminobutanoate/2-iminopropanoate deaminase
MAERVIISTDQGPRTGLPYSQAVRHGDLVYVAGQVAMDPATGQFVEGDIRVQTRRVLDNIQAILEAAGTSLAHALEAICILQDGRDFAAFNEVYRAYFPAAPPARTTFQGVLLRPGLLVEIRVVAAVPRTRARARPRAAARGRARGRAQPRAGSASRARRR